MLFPGFPTLLRLRFIWLILFCCFWLLSGASLQAAESADASLSPAAQSAFPEQLGTIVYQTEPEASSRIYIIANGHRSAINGANTTDTVQAQIETFRIGEWLIKRNRIDLLLPEGFFGEKGRSRAIDADETPLDNQTLRNALADTTHFINAELLLHEQYGIGLGQVENRQLYRDVREQLRSRLKAGAEFSFTLYSELARLQKLRTAYLLQAAPAVTAAAYQQGRITTPNAMMTIGLSHLKDIISFLESGKTDFGQQTEGSAYPLPETDLEQIKSPVGITVVVPRTLMAKGYTLVTSSGLAKNQSSRDDQEKTF
jgi:hypothetical protein